jgi:hypothetical protein
MHLMKFYDPARVQIFTPTDNEDILNPTQLRECEKCDMTRFFLKWYLRKLLQHLNHHTFIIILGSKNFKFNTSTWYVSQWLDSKSVALQFRLKRTLSFHIHYEKEYEVISISNFLVRFKLTCVQLTGKLFSPKEL